MAKKGGEAQPETQKGATTAAEFRAMDHDGQAKRTSEPRPVTTGRTRTPVQPGPGGRGTV